MAFTYIDIYCLMMYENTAHPKLSSLQYCDQLSVIVLHLHETKQDVAVFG